MSEGQDNIFRVQFLRDDRAVDSYVVDFEDFTALSRLAFTAQESFAYWKKYVLPTLLNEGDEDVK